MKPIILLCFLTIIFNSYPLYGQSKHKEQGEIFWANHKEAILSVYLEYEKFNKIWSERTQKINVDSIKKLGATRVTSNGDYEYTTYPIQANVIVQDIERSKIESIVAKSPILRAKFEVGLIYINRIVTSIVYPNKFEDKDNVFNQDWDKDLKYFGGLLHTFENVGKNDILVECITYNTNTNGKNKRKKKRKFDMIRIEVTSNFGKCVLYCKLDND